MKIIKPDYDFFREDLQNYYIKNLSASSISYTLYSIKNSNKVLVGLTNIEITAGSTILIDIPVEGLYSVKIVVDSIVAYYDIRALYNIKVSVLDLIRRSISDCNQLDPECGENSSIPFNVSRLYNTQLLTSSQGLYLHLFFPKDYIYDYRKCFDVTLTNDSISFIDLMEQYYSNILINGNIDSKAHLLRIYMGYIYILLYTLELNYASYPDFPDSSASDETDLVKSLFDLESIESSFSELNIDYISVIETLQACLVSDMPVVYSGTLFTDTWPNEEVILLGDSLTTTLNPSYIPFHPSTSDNQYKWFAIPEDIAILFTSWDEDESELNNDLIGTASSSQFIIRADTVISVNSISYRLFKYNWASSFSTILKLS